MRACGNTLSLNRAGLYASAPSGKWHRSLRAMLARSDHRPRRGAAVNTCMNAPRVDTGYVELSPGFSTPGDCRYCRNALYRIGRIPPRERKSIDATLAARLLALAPLGEVGLHLFRHRDYVLSLYGRHDLCLQDETHLHSKELFNGLT
ncbi:hypothetical protein CSAL01_13614 [Colletotrichum salicis]|uniref:Uncharacterized protein n=1 Tax=Colletotrichum salicis TaxID=1209931 RepID=A0A135S341_9PEZI|nr:hypothetical protein CSAL01_13614 [Colletotrichum salicis]